MLTSKTLLYRLIDIALIITGALFAADLGSSDLVLGGSGALAASATALSAVGYLAIFRAVGVYDDGSRRSLNNRMSRVLIAWLATQTGTLIVVFAIHHGSPLPSMWFADWTVATLVGLLVSRLFAHDIINRAQQARSTLRNVALVGSVEHCEQLMQKMIPSEYAGYRAVMALDLSGGGTDDHRIGIACYADLSTFARHVRAEHVRELWLALPLSEQAQIEALVAEFRDDLINIRFLPDVRSLAMFDTALTDLDGIAAINLVASPLSPLALAKKDIFDRLFALVALIALMPLMLAIAVCIKLTSRGPVLFSQARRGADGQVFRILKFRSMSAHAQAPGVLVQATRDDPRITRIGALLRRTSLDELPQFFNVLRGDMSVVGPRPHAIEHDALYRTVVDDYIQRYRIKPGITGWAQVNGFRGETDRIEKMQGRVDHDLYYLRNWSFALDMRIVLATVFKGLIHGNAY